MKTAVDAPVRGQLEAYNQRNIEAFVEFFADDIETQVMDKPETLKKGIAEFKKTYGEMFAASPNLHAAIVNRTVINQYVFDEEVVKGRMGSDELLHVMAIYQIEGNKIKKVWFCR